MVANDKIRSVRECLEVLRTYEKTWCFDKKENIPEKLLALDQLSKTGRASVIQSLIPYLKHPSERIKKKTVDVIRILFNQLNGKNAYYQTLKRCFISREDISFYKTNFRQIDVILLLKISSLNSNGYVREKAVKELGKVDEASVLPFIVYRIADWVPQISKVAKNALKIFLVSEYHTAIINHLVVFKWLEGVERTNTHEVYADVIEYLSVQYIEETLQKFSQTNDKSRLILAKILSNKSNISTRVLNLIANDKSFLIRLLALDNFERLNDVQKAMLLNDKSALVRKQTLLMYKDSIEFTELLNRYITDRSGSIRYISRYYLKLSPEDYRVKCIDNLKTGREIIGSMMGLLDIEAKDCIKYIAPYLKYDKVSVVKTAFYVLSRLGYRSVYKFAKENLFTDQLGLRRLVLDYFGEYQSEEIIEILRDRLKNSDDETKKIILKLFGKVGGYNVLPDLLRGTIDTNKSIRDLAILYVQKWKDKAVRIYIEPTDEQKEQANIVLEKVIEVNKQKNYFNAHFLEELMFFIR